MPGRTPRPDRFGYTGYGVAIVMPENVRQEVAKVREQPGLPASTTPPHVTVKGTFADPTDLEEVIEITSAAAADTTPFAVEFGDLTVWDAHDRRIVVVSVMRSPELDRLHRRLMCGIGPISTSVYLPDRPEPVEGFRFHLTLYQGADELRHARGMQAARDLSLPARVEASGISLFARVNRPAGHEWRQLQDFPFATRRPCGV
ncbi:MAG: 2'-5' RNA ligase family protein [Chloroflexi bacterium]|nr:2'-5' RNA ligase family protein [Chloroflexota bacterium]